MGFFLQRARPWSVVCSLMMACLTAWLNLKLNDNLRKSGCHGTARGPSVLFHFERMVCNPIFCCCFFYLPTTWQQLATTPWKDSSIPSGIDGHSTWRWRDRSQAFSSLRVRGGTQFVGTTERTALSFLGESQDANEIVVGYIRVGPDLKIMRFVNLFTGKCCIFHSHLYTNVGIC